VFFRCVLSALFAIPLACLPLIYAHLVFFAISPVFLPFLSLAMLGSIVRLGPIPVLPSRALPSFIVPKKVQPRLFVRSEPIALRRLFPFFRIAMLDSIAINRVFQMFLEFVQLDIIALLVLRLHFRTLLWLDTFRLLNLSIQLFVQFRTTVRPPLCQLPLSLPWAIL
jgi:hypothetical protein